MRVIQQAHDKWVIYHDDGSVTGDLSVLEVWHRYPEALDACAAQAIKVRVSEDPLYAIAYAGLKLAEALEKARASGPKDQMFN
jgi:hypothetical protein